MCYGSQDSLYESYSNEVEAPSKSEIRKDLRVQIKAAKDVLRGKVKKLRDYTKVVTTL